MRARRAFRIAPEAAATLQTLPPPSKSKVREAIDAIRDDPAIGRELVRELAGYRRLPVGRLRVVYRVTARRLEIIAIGPRATIYLELAARRVSPRRSPPG